MNKFKVGDVVIGISNTYSVTGRQSISIIRGICGPNNMDIECIKSSSKCDFYYDNVYYVRSEDFKKFDCDLKWVKLLYAEK